MTVPPEQSGGQNSAYRSGCRNSISQFTLGAHFMSAPSRRPEIRRRRARQHKITTLRKRLASAQTDADRNRVTAKLHKLAIASPGQPLLK
jgi:Family of unknown function (DUF6800)